jgi:hypothetical protein
VSPLGLTVVLALSAAQVFGAAAQQSEGAVCRAARANSKGLQSFWNQFRHAALTGDYDQIAATVRFPLTVADLVDESSQRHVGRASFDKTFQRFLASDAGTDVTETSMHDFIARTPCLADEELNAAGDSAQVARMVFVHSGSRWLLSEIFLSDSP